MLKKVTLSNKQYKVSKKIFDKYLQPLLIDSSPMKKWKTFKRNFPVSFVEMRPTYDKISKKTTWVLVNHLILTVSPLTS